MELQEGSSCVDDPSSFIDRSSPSDPKSLILQLELEFDKVRQERPAEKLAYGEMQYAVALEMKYKRLRYSHSLAEEVVL